MVWSFAMVEERMIEAVGFLDRCTRGGGSPFAGDGPWSQIIRDRNAAAQVGGEVADWIESDMDGAAKARGGLRAAEVDRMEQALEWIRYVKDRARLRPLVGIVLQQKLHYGRDARVDWAEVKRRLRSGDTHDVLRMGYSRSIATICMQLNRAHVAVS
ncbi:hypothetical protein [Sphingomonas nostoxanthinifaciens]|uniref:hypothetical protein n=1 Tax=Sphingomonas nostoxanthinifaciens TaxID=2872652 RepID=UPI001CC1DB07|nr:hypothetical protein [Sphingomonas nostoxanthinifaciens]UAK24197.1 hypothetical protein K8P63_18000 [Sphingomonas nostoxanthinifaciens]